MRILLGMSGGVDSTYSAEILKNEGHVIEGAVLVMHGETDTDGAVRAAEKAGIPIHVIDCKAEFEKNVSDFFVREYACGRTPNPCTVCNRTVKFQKLCEFASENGFDRIATGHYADVCYENGRYYIKKGADERKDQSYMLWNLTQEQLSRLTLPLARLTKSEIKASALELGIEAASRPESQDICFLPDGNYAEFVASRLGEGYAKAASEGDFTDPDGNVLGRHKGIINYTVGQRKGLGIALGKRMFVSAIDPVKNTVTLMPDGGAYSRKAQIGSLNFQKMSAPVNGETEIRADVKVRYAAKPVTADIRIKGEMAEIEFAEEVRAVTPGQSAVVYGEDGGILFGGAFV